MNGASFTARQLHPNAVEILILLPNNSKVNFMAHPSTGQGNNFKPEHSFAEAYTFVGIKGVKFRSTTNEEIYARQGLAADGVTPTIVFMGERNRHGSVCKACWGFRVDCNQSRIGQCAEALDLVIRR